MQIHISGRVERSECRFMPDGCPVLRLEMEAPELTMRASHTYPDSSHASVLAARALASRLRGQHIELTLTEPRMRGRRLEGSAPVIHPPPSARKDLS